MWSAAWRQMAGQMRYAKTSQGALRCAHHAGHQPLLPPRLGLPHPRRLPPRRENGVLFRIALLSLIGTMSTWSVAWRQMAEHRRCAKTSREALRCAHHAGRQRHLRPRLDHLLCPRHLPHRRENGALFRIASVSSIGMVSTSLVAWRRMGVRMPFARTSRGISHIALLVPVRSLCDFVLTDGG